MQKHFSFVNMLENNFFILLRNIGSVKFVISMIVVEMYINVNFLLQFCHTASKNICYYFGAVSV